MSTVRICDVCGEIITMPLFSPPMKIEIKRICKSSEELELCSRCSNLVEAYCIKIREEKNNG